MVTVISKLLLFNIGEIYYILFQFFPAIAESFVKTIFILSKQPTAFNLISILLSIYFSKDFFLSMTKAFSYTMEKNFENRFSIYVMTLSLPIVLILFISIYILKFLLILIFHSFSLIVNYLNLLFDEKIVYFVINTVSQMYNIILAGNLFELSTLSIFIFTAYYFLAGVKMKKAVFYISIIVSLVILILKNIFGFIFSHFIVKSPVFAASGLIFAVILWFKIMFDIFLLGSRLLYYIEKASLEEA